MCSRVGQTQAQRPRSREGGARSGRSEGQGAETQQQLFMVQQEIAGGVSSVPQPEPSQSCLAHLLLSKFIGAMGASGGSVAVTPEPWNVMSVLSCQHFQTSELDHVPLGCATLNIASEQAMTPVAAVPVTSATSLHVKDGFSGHVTLLIQFPCINRMITAAVRVMRLRSRILHGTFTILTEFCVMAFLITAVPVMRLMSRHPHNAQAKTHCDILHDVVGATVVLHSDSTFSLRPNFSARKINHSCSLSNVTQTPQAQQQGLEAASATTWQGTTEGEFGELPCNTCELLGVKPEKMKAQKTIKNKWFEIVLFNDSFFGNTQKGTQEIEEIGNMYMENWPQKEREHRDDEAWSQLRGWRAAAEEAEKTEQERKAPKWSKVGPKWLGRKENVCAHQQVFFDTITKSMAGVIPQNGDNPKAIM